MKTRSIVPNPSTPREEFRFVRSVRIENFRGIKNLRLDFPEKGRADSSAAGSIILLGDNATGKTCALQAAALGSIGPLKASFKKPSWCLKRGANEGQVSVDFWDSSASNWIDFANDRKDFSGDEAIKTTVMGYGAYRLPAYRKSRRWGQGLDFRIETLFDERGLVDGLKRLTSQFFENRIGLSNQAADCIRTLNALLLDAAQVGFSHGSLQVYDGATVQDAQYLSSGYKSVMTLAADIMYLMYTVFESTSSGVCLILIDELDVHLHPSWRLLVVDAFRTAFPMAQFLITSHDPLLLRGMDKEEIRILRKSVAGDVEVVRPSIPDTKSLYVDQILTSDLFGMESTLSKEYFDNLSEMYDLQSYDRKTAEQQSRLRYLIEAVGNTPPLGMTRYDRIMHSVIQRRILSSQTELNVDSWNKEIIESISNEIERIYSGSN